MDRFIVKAKSHGSGESFNVLVDQKTGREVFHDCMEIEDATLDRDLSPLVRLLNKLSEEE